MYIIHINAHFKCCHHYQENTKQTSEYFVESANDNDAWEWDNDFLNEAFSGEDFRNMDSSSNDK